MSLELGKNHSFLQQFVRRGVPAELPERVRKLLAKKLDVPEERLRTWHEASAAARDPDRTTSGKSPLDDAMWSIWSRAKPAERHLIVNIAKTILASRKEPS